MRQEVEPLYDTRGTLYDQDTGLRRDTDTEKLAKLKPVFDRKYGTITAANSSPLTDGAAALLVCTEDYAERHGLDVLARLRSIAVAGCAAEVMGIGPVAATRKALARAGLEPAGPGRDPRAGGDHRRRGGSAPPREGGRSRHARAAGAGGVGGDPTGRGSRGG